MKKSIIKIVYLLFAVKEHFYNNKILVKILVKNV